MIKGRPYYSDKMNNTTSQNYISLVIPFPPSVNTYWGFHGHRRFLTKKANQFKQDVRNVFAQTGSNGFGAADLSVSIALYPPDARTRDIDNILKPTLDALVQAGVFDDDSQVSRLFVIRSTKHAGGKAEIEIERI